MDFTTERVKIGNQFKVDEDGIMTVNACILKTGVFPYLESEFIENGSNEPIPVYIPDSAFTPEALESGEGRDVIVGDHIWRTAENSMHDGHTVGSIAGVLHRENGKIFCKLRIDDKETVDKVLAKELVEISAGYRADFQQEDGIYNGEPYKYLQSNIVFNHVLLLPVGEGRCGSDVKVINKKQQGENQMSKTLRVKIGNVDKSVEFSNEDDAGKAEELVEEVKKTSAVDVDNALEEVKTLKEEVETKNAELEEKKKIIEEYKEKLEEALSPEKQEELAEELAEQKVAENEVIETEIDDEEKEEVKNKCHTMNRKDRILYLAEKVLNKKGFDCSGMSEDRKIGAFQAIALDAHIKVQNKKANKTFVPGAKALNAKATDAHSSSVARMFSFTGVKK